MSLLQNSNAIPQLGGVYDLTDSVRFRESASAYLERTPASAGNLKTWTWSAWVKRGNVADSSYYCLFGVDGVTPTNRTEITFSSNAIFIYEQVTTATISLTTTGLFRDPSAWYHIVVAIDTTQATSTNRVKLYVNGEQITSFSSATYPSLNYNTFVNSTNTHVTGARRYSNGTVNKYFDGYLTEVNFVDGQALTPSYFGNYNEDTGVWQPKKYTGTYGTNGFYLDMSTSGSTVTDQSSNSNNWTATNMNLTTSSATTYDKMSDVPTLTDEDTCNFATFNPLDHFSTNVDFSEANLTHTVPAGSYSNGGVATSNITMTSGKWYCEMTALSTRSMVGIAKLPRDNMRYLGEKVTGYGYYYDGKKYNNAGSSSYGASYTTNDIIGIALDLDAGTLIFYKNGVSQGTAFTGLSGEFVFATGNTNVSVTVSTAVNFGQRPFAYTPPTGYKKLNTYNLPDSTTVDGSQHFVTAIYTGDGASTRTIDNTITDASGVETGDPIQFSPDFVWIKNRGSTYNHLLMDSIRGADRILKSNDTGAEGTATYNNAFLSNGFYFGSASVAWNQNGVGHVMWQWRGSDSSPVSNTDGTITSTVSANPTAGFSVVTYTGNGASNQSIGHGLSTAPKVLICKERNNARLWDFTYTCGDGSYDFMKLNATDAKLDITGRSAPTNSLIYVNGANSNNNTSTYVAYCFAEVEGFSKFGSYTGNGSTDGTFVYTGFRPAFMMVKRTDAITNWLLIDNTRNPYNGVDKHLHPNLSNAESTAGNPWSDFLSNGFKLRASYGETNTSGGTYIYMAFAENPFKNSLAR